MTTFLPVFLILLLSSFFTFEAHRIATRGKEVQRTGIVLGLDARGMNLILDMETGVRGFLLTGDPIFLDTLSDTPNQIEQCLHRLEIAVAPEPGQLAALDSIRSHFRSWLVLSQQLQKLKKSHPSSSADLQTNLQSKHEIDAIRLAFKSIRDFHLSVLRAQQDKSEKAMTWMLLWGVLLSVSFATLIAFFIQRRLSLQYREKLAEGERADRLFHQLETIIDAAPIAIVYLDRNLRYVFTNKYYREHYDRKSLVGRTVEEGIGSQAYERVRPLLERALQGEVLTLETEVTRTDGTTFSVNGIYAPSFDASGKVEGVVAISEDITERKLREEALTAAIKIRDQFLSIASHELKTPLTSLQLLTQLRMRELKRDYPAAFSAEKIEAGFKQQYEHVRKISQLVDNILDVTRISEGRLQLKTEPFDLNDMTSEVLGRFSVTAESLGVAISFLRGDEVTGTWDRFRLEQVLLNLLTNAVKYGNKTPVLVQVARDAGKAVIRVKDSGIGIEPADQGRVFQRFERAVSENEVSGLGLGLYISKEIVEAHGGEIRLKSEIGLGSEFSVELPLTT